VRHTILLHELLIVSGQGLTNRWEPWQRLIDLIGPYYRTQLFAARDRARDELCDLDEERLEAIAAEGRAVAGSLDEEGAHLTVTLTEDRERHSRLAGDLQREAELLLRRRRWALASRRRRQARADAAEQVDRAEEHRQRAAHAHERLRELGNSGRHMCMWFERHQEVLARGMAAELTLDAAQGAVYHLLGAPGIASLTAACLTSDRAIDLGQLQELVKNGGESRQRLLFEVAAELYGREQGYRSASCSPSWTAKTWTACSTRSALSSGAGSRSLGRRAISGYAPPNLTRNQTAEADRFPTRRGRPSSARGPSTIAGCRRRSGVLSLNRCT
jgi:hypothetical protein